MATGLLPNDEDLSCLLCIILSILSPDPLLLSNARKKMESLINIVGGVPNSLKIFLLQNKWGII